MKFFLAITLIVAVASAAVIRPLRSEIAEIQEIIAAIQSPSTDPATAAALEQMLLDALGISVGPAMIENPLEGIAVGPAMIENPLEGIAVGPAMIENPLEGIAVGPAIIENPLEGIAVGPAIIDFPLPDGGAVSAPVVAPSPVAIVDGPAAEDSASAPLVQIIVNINQAGESSPVAVSPVAVAPEIQPTPVHVVDSVSEPAQPPINPIVVNPIGVVAPQPPINPIAVNPIGVVAPQPPINPIAVNPIGVAPVEPVQIGIPVIPEAAVVLPEELN